MGGNGIVLSDNSLITGKGKFDCSTVAAGDNTKCKTHRLRLIKSGGEAVQRFSIDDHTLTVIANDFVKVKPYDAKVVTLGIGQRTDVLIKANAGNNNNRGSYWMRSNISSCSLTNQPLGIAAVYYDQADQTLAPNTSTAWNVPDTGNYVNNDLAITKPVMKLKLAAAAVKMTMEINWSLDGVVFRDNSNQPALPQANRGDLVFDDDWNIDNFGNNGNIIVAVSHNSPAAHPLRLEQNPGVWPFHCHIAWHSSAGLFAQFLLQPEKVKQLNTTQKSNIPDVIDSGQ
ncbi:Cupredoxin [Colletotrichum caudatum]|nr:Cupredoxin [Colletotrichum caudatum]